MSRQNGSSDTATSGRKRKESGSGTMKCRVKRSDERLKIASGFLPASCRHVPLMLQKGSFRKAKGQELSCKRARMTIQKLPFYKTTHKRLIYNADKKYGLLPSITGIIAKGLLPDGASEPKPVSADYRPDGTSACGRHGRHGKTKRLSG